MRFIADLAAAVLVAAAPTVAAAAPAPEQVEFQAGALTIKAELYRPDGNGPFPAVIGMHGCDGLRNSGGNVISRFRDWAEHLGKAGFAVLLVDSYGSRNLGSQCRNRAVVVRTNRERVADANAAKDWLQQQSYVKADHVSLIGWSNGGISVLWTVRPRLVPRSEPRDSRPDFRSAVAFYPGCNRLDNTAWSARVPTLILIGAADDWTSSRQCEKMVAGARGRSARIQIVVYAGTYHDFDHPTRPVQVRTGYAFSVDGSGKIHTGSNPGARADAFKRVPAWIAR
jgi:dienelactone hydrolase